MIEIEIKYGAKVTDMNGKVLGTVDHLVYNILNGEITKFIVRRKVSADLILAPEDVLEVIDTKIRLKIAIK